MITDKIILFLKKYKRNVVLILFFVSFLPLFFYNLGSFGLDDFDEAWYGEIARNVIKSNQHILLTFNGLPFYDHPPLGFNLMALSYKIFGVREFSVRFSAALLGFFSVILIYLIGKELVNRFVGLSSALVLLSCVWFIFRARSGNLDTIFLFFYLLVFFAALKIKKNPLNIYLFFSSLACVILTKSFIGISVLIPSFIYLLIGKVKLSWKKTIIGLLIFVSIICPWIILHFREGGINYFINLFNFATRSSTQQPVNLRSLFSTNTFLYIHYGIGKWYYPFLFSIIASFVLTLKKKIFLPLYGILFFLLYGFLTNSKTEIWHLIILYPFIGLLLSSCLYYLIYYGFTIFEISGIKVNKKVRHFIYYSVLFVLFFISMRQIYFFRNNIRLFDKGVNAVAYVSTFAKGRSEKLYLGGSDFLPSTVFYSGKKVNFLRYENPPINNLKNLSQIKDKEYLLLTEKWRMEADGVDWSNFTILAEENGYMMLLYR
jgi:4-amino-4-deoxy-L-arabinose transferase-like glycosyltransferase